MQYSPIIDGLRGFAVIIVILFHSGFEVFTGGFVGVDVFFVISGYLITSIVLSELNAGRFRLGSFCERRIKRLVPALFFVIACCIPIAWHLLSPHDMKDFSQGVFAATTFFSNILFWVKSGYFETANDFNPLIHTWSLGVEVQYYIIFSIFMVLIYRYSKAFLHLWVLILLIFSFALSQYASDEIKAANFYMVPTRIWEFLVGSFCAFYIKSLKLGEVLSSIFVSSGLFFILVAVFTFGGATPFPGAYALLPTFGAAFVILGSQHSNYVNTILKSRVLVGTGLVSYSLYLWHQPILAFARHSKIGSLTVPEIILSIGVSGVFSALTYFLIERPFRRRDGVPFPLVTLLLIGLMIGSFGIIGHLTEGYKGTRFDQEELQLFDTARSSPLRERCHYQRGDKFSAAESCQYNTDPVEWAVFGNSHGVELAYQFANEIELRNSGLIHFTISGCDSSFGRQLSSYCDNFFRDRLEFLAMTPTVRNILLTFRQDNNDLEDVTAVVGLANYLASLDKNVFLVLQAPVLPARIDTYLMRGIRLQDVVSRRRASWESLFAHVYDSTDNLSPRVEVVDLADAFCDETYCFALRQGNALFFDDSHMSLAGAKLAVRKIIDNETVRKLLGEAGEESEK